MADFIKWNPALGSSCSGLIIGDYYCVSVPGTPTTRSGSTGPTALPSNGVGPQPEQPGIPSDCSQYWFVGMLVCDAEIYVQDAEKNLETITALPLQPKTILH